MRRPEEPPGKRLQGELPGTRDTTSENRRDTMSWLSRLANVFHTNRLDRDLDDELQFHIETRTEDLIATGMSRAEARRQAQRHFGNRLLLRESSRDAKLLSWLESIFQDARFVLRMLLKNRVV